MKKFVITLKEREDRREHFSNKNTQLKDYTFIIATDKKDINLHSLTNSGYKTRSNWRDPFTNRKITTGEIACFISHYKLWLECVKINEPIIIFEDDAILLSNWDESKIALTNDIDIMYLSRNENEPEKVESIDDMWEKPFYPYNMTSYVITPKGAKKLTSTNILQTIVPVDEYLPELIQAGYINAVALKEDMVDQVSRNIMGSDIEPNSEDDYLIDFNVHVLTVGTDRKKCQKLYDSGMFKSIYPKNLGENIDWTGGDMSMGIGGGMKINLLKKFIKDKSNSDVVLFVDGYDVFFTDNLNTIIKRWIGFNTKVLFGAEKYCWPDESLSKEFPKSNTPYRYLNSGTFIAEVGELKKILTNNIADEEDDQLYYQKEFLSGKYDIKLDTEGYVFITNEEQAQKSGTQLYNPVTQCFGCIYHGNGGDEAKIKFDKLYNDFYPKMKNFFIPQYSKVHIMEKDMLLVDFMTQSQCERMIDLADEHGGWGQLSYDKFPAQEIRAKELGFFDELDSYWKKHLYPIIEKHWAPIEMYGIRDAFVMRYSLDTQVSLSYHNDASLVTGSVKLNNDYEGAELVFPRQSITQKDVPVGKCILFPGMVTHGHECTELKSGVKYSLTMWSQRYPGDIL